MVGRAISASILSHVLLLVVLLLPAKKINIYSVLRTFTGGKVACGEPLKTLHGFIRSHKIVTERVRGLTWLDVAPFRDSLRTVITTGPPCVIFFFFVLSRNSTTRKTT